MSIQNQIDRLNHRISESYAAAQSKGATMPPEKNSDNLPNTISTIPQGGGGGLAITEVSDATQGITATYVRQGNIVFATVLDMWGFGIGPFWTTIPQGFRASYPASTGVAIMDYNIGVTSAANLTASGNIMELYTLDGNTSFGANWIISLFWMTIDAFPTQATTEDVGLSLAKLEENFKDVKADFEKLMKQTPKMRKAEFKKMQAKSKSAKTETTK